MFCAFGVCACVRSSSSARVNGVGNPPLTRRTTVDLPKFDFEIHGCRGGAPPWSRSVVWVCHVILSKPHGCDAIIVVCDVTLWSDRTRVGRWPWGLVRRMSERAPTQASGPRRRRPHSRETPSEDGCARGRERVVCACARARA